MRRFVHALRFVRLLRRLLRAARLGLALLELEDAEAGGASVCIHNSWCSAPGSGWWIAIVRPRRYGEWSKEKAPPALGKAPPALGKPIVGRDLRDVMRRARELAIDSSALAGEE